MHGYKWPIKCTRTRTGTGVCAAVLLGFGSASGSDCLKLDPACVYTARVSAMDAREAADAKCTHPEDDEFEGDATSRESCEETGNAYLASGYWIEQDTSQPPPRVSDEDLDVRCGARVSMIVPVNGGNDEAARLGGYKGTRWGTTPGTPTIGGK